MTTTDLILHLLASFGLVYAVVYMEPPIISRAVDALALRSEFFRELLSCPLCTGFWVGSGLYAAKFTITTESWEARVLFSTAFTILLMGLASAGFCYLASLLAQRLSTDDEYEMDFSGSTVSTTLTDDVGE